ncbi:hypothetical protein BGW36DRAFT_370331, partial [Talaromyces proteolyticus]
MNAAYLIYPLLILPAVMSPPLRTNIVRRCFKWHDGDFRSRALLSTFILSIYSVITHDHVQDLLVSKHIAIDINSYI